MTRDVSWEYLLGIEPRLKQLLQAVWGLKAVRNSKAHFCANSYWLYNPRGLSYNQVLQKWLGSDAETYKIAAEKIYSSLPDCKNCFCSLVKLTPKSTRLNQIEKLFKKLKRASDLFQKRPQDLGIFLREAEPIFKELETLGVERTFSESVFTFGPDVTPDLVLQFEEGKESKEGVGYEPADKGRK